MVKHPSVVIKNQNILRGQNALSTSLRGLCLNDFLLGFIFKGMVGLDIGSPPITTHLLYPGLGPAISKEV
jgi:hypothetical protein